jgi:hypothetical protein
MHRKNKHLLIILSVIILLFLNAHFSFALEITSYPPVPGLIAPSANCTGSDCLSIYIAYWFGLLVYLAGALSLISFTIGAVGLIASTDNAEAQSNAKDRMRGAVLGLVLTLASFIIIKTINPTLITPTLTPLPGVEGVFYTNGSEDKPVGLEESNVANRGEELIKNGFDRIIYKCSEGGDAIAPTLLIWEFPRPGFQGNDSSYGGARVVRKRCGEIEPIASWGSFRMAFEVPGVYYFLGSGCNGFGSDVKLTSQTKLDDAFVGKIKSVRIVNNPANHDYYGVIFHKTPGENSAGDCTNPIAVGGISGCENLSSFSVSPDFSAYAADIFNWNKDNATSSGDGVAFYSEPDGWNADKQAGEYNVPSTTLKNFFAKEADKIVFDWTGVDSDIAMLCYGYYPSCSDEAAISSEDCCPCESFQDCPGSLRLKGNYLAAFYTYYYDDKKAKHLYCQTFKKNAADLTLEKFLPPGNTPLGLVNIIPTH